MRYKELWGRRQEKYDWLGAHDVESADWRDITSTADRRTCLGDFHFFVPHDFPNLDEYCKGWSVEDIFDTYQNGLKTDRDSLFFDFDRDELEQRIQTFYSSEGLSRSFREEYNINDSSSYPLLDRRERTSFDAANIHRCLYRPLNKRWLYYEPGLTSRPAWGVMRHMLADENLGIITTRQTRDAWGLTATDALCGHKSCAAYDINTLFPLYLYPDDEEAKRREAAPELSLGDGAPGGRRPNLTAAFIEAGKKRWGLRFEPDGTGDLESTFGPEDVLRYAYAVFHSLAYRTRYDELLRIDFPRLPLTADLGLVRTLCAKGKRLIDLHLMRANGLDGKPGFPVAGSNEVASGHPRYTPPSADGETPGRVHINAEQYFEGVEPAVWSFYVGGYQVCDKWLKDRKGRLPLSYEDQSHYRAVVATLRETQQIMAAVDETVEAHGGWPLM